MLRRLMKTGGALTLRCTGTDKLLRRLVGMKDVPVVVGYHRVVEDVPSEAGDGVPAMFISRSMLERHLDWIGRRFRFVSLDELGSRLESGESFERPVAAVTFDDGYSDLYEYGLPLLKRKGIPAAVFVVTGMVGEPGPYLHDKVYVLLRRAFSFWRSAPKTLARLLCELGIDLPGLATFRPGAENAFGVTRLLLDNLAQADLRRLLDSLEASLPPLREPPRLARPLTWPMLRELLGAGIIVGSHTRSHSVLTAESWAKILEEAKSSKEQLEKTLGITARHFAFPGGHFNPLAVKAVAQAGYQFAYTGCRHRDPDYPLLTIPRKILWENACLDITGNFSPALMSCQMNWAFDLLPGCRQDHGLPAGNAAFEAVASVTRS